MSTEQILSLLIAERDRLSNAIDALQGGSKRRGRPPGRTPSAPAAASPSAPATVAAAPKKRKRKALTAAQKKAHSDRMKAFWAERRKQPAKKKA